MKIIIVGGTHGNEKTGVFLAEKWTQSIASLPEDHEYKICFGNERAIQEDKRFIDFDLNRSFQSSRVKPSDYEQKRAQEIEEELMSWMGKDHGYLIDLHSTTSNMGLTLVLSKTDLFSAHVVKTVVDKRKEVTVLFNTHMDRDSVFLESVAPSGVLVEVGPVAHNVFDARLIQRTEFLVYDLINAITDVSKRGKLEPISIEGYQELGPTHFPKLDSGERVIVHPDRLGRDYEPMAPGDPLFLTTSGETLSYDGSTTIFPVFIAEAGYQYENIAYRPSVKTVRDFS